MKNPSKEQIKKWNREYYLRNKTKRREQYLKFKRELNDWYQKLKNNLSCVRCGESHPATIQFHHVNDKDLAISRMVSDGYSKERIELEIKKCIVLCANCHFKEHWDASRNGNGPDS